MADLVVHKDLAHEYKMQIGKLQEALEIKDRACLRDHVTRSEAARIKRNESDEVERIKQENRDLTERLEQQKAVKENLREKVRSLEGRVQEASANKETLTSNRDECQKELEQFKEDVAYLTKEAGMLLDELQSE